MGPCATVIMGPCITAERSRVLCGREHVHAASPTRRMEGRGKQHANHRARGRPAAVIRSFSKTRLRDGLQIYERKTADMQAIEPPRPCSPSSLLIPTF